MNGDGSSKPETNLKNDNDQHQYEQDLRERQNVRDGAGIEQREDKQFRLVAEWLRWAVWFRVDTDHPPHVVEEHEYRSAWCHWAAAALCLGGLAVAVYLTATGVTSPFWGVVAGVVGFATGAIFAGVAIEAFNRDRFVSTFRWWVWSPGLLVFCGIIGIVAARLPGSGEFFATHQELLTISWLAVEFGLLWGTATCHVAAYYYGWSGRITRRYLVIQEEIRQLQLGIEANNRRMDALKKAMALVAPAVKVVAFVVLLGALYGRSIFGQCLTEFDDGTLSLNRERRAEAQGTFVDVVGRHVDAVKCISIVRFSGAPPEQPRTFTLNYVPQHQLSPYARPFKHVLDAFEKQDAEDRKQYVQEKLAKLRQYLAERLPEPPCTSGRDISDQISTVMDDGSLGVLITDGVFDCTSLAHGAEVQFHNLLVFLVPHEGDDGTTFATGFHARKKLVERYLPGAQVYPSYVLGIKLEKAIASHWGRADYAMATTGPATASEGPAR
jgi:hypothetical protein